MSNQLAISGGTPVRNTESEPWSSWPLTTTEEWESKVEPLLREVYLSGNEGSGGTMIERFRRTVCSVFWNELRALHATRHGFNQCCLSRCAGSRWI